MKLIETRLLPRSGSRLLDLRIADNIPLRVADLIARRVGKRNLLGLSRRERIVLPAIRLIARLVARSAAPLRGLFPFSLVHIVAPSFSRKRDRKGDVPGRACAWNEVQLERIPGPADRGRVWFKVPQFPNGPVLPVL